MPYHIRKKNLLPKSIYQKIFKITPKRVCKNNLHAMKLEHPVAYNQIMCYWWEYLRGESADNVLKLISGNKFSVDLVINYIPPKQVFWEKLSLKGNVIAEIILLIRGDEAIVVFLKLIPLIDSLNCLTKEGIIFSYFQILNEVLKNLRVYACQKRCKKIVVDVVNPNLVPLFEEVNFSLTESHQHIYSYRMELILHR